MLAELAERLSQALKEEAELQTAVSRLLNRRSKIQAYFRLSEVLRLIPLRMLMECSKVERASNARINGHSAGHRTRLCSGQALLRCSR